MLFLDGAKRFEEAERTGSSRSLASALALVSRARNKLGDWVVTEESTHHKETNSLHHHHIPS